MPGGYNNRILRVNLATGATAVEQPGENFFRQHFGGQGLIAHYLLKEVPAGADPLGPENKLIFAPGVVTGTPVPGSGRHCVGAKSPLTGGHGSAEVGGWWGAELKRTGFDAIIVEGQADRPVYLWVHDGAAELRDAGHLWGQPTYPTEQAIQAELGDKRVRVAQIGPAGERLVRFAAVICDVNRAAGRTGLGAVMGSKKLKAIAVRGTQSPEVADGAKLRAIAKWAGGDGMGMVTAMHDQGTAVVVSGLNFTGSLPTRNFSGGSFEGASNITGEAMNNSILVDSDNCHVCPVRCKRVVALAEPYKLERHYGGPEYEAIGAFGSNCGIDDLKAIAAANQLCNAHGLDAISTGNVIAFAMECFERGLISAGDAGGLQLTFGNADAMVKTVELIIARSGLGDTLAEGVKRAAAKIGGDAASFANHVKGQEAPMHEPRYKRGMGLTWGVSPTGADHNQVDHDTVYRKPGPYFDKIKALGIFEPMDPRDLGPAKVRWAVYQHYWQTMLNCMVLCNFLPYNLIQLEEIARGVTGWNTTMWEMLKVGQRTLALCRLFNRREGFRRADDLLPPRYFTPLTSGKLEGVALDRDEFERALTTYYRMTGCDEQGEPYPETLSELGIDWAIQKG